MKLNNNDSLIIKVGDLLHKQGSSDIVPLSNMSIGDTITDIVGKVVITCVSADELFITIKDLSYVLHAPCDYCGKETRFAKTVLNESYTFMLEQHITPELLEEETIFPIMTDGSIDLYPVIRDTILLTDEVQHVCEDCNIRLSQDKDKEINEDEHISWNIVFK